MTRTSEVNAASSVSALVHSGLFDLTTTYFLIAGIAGMNPNVATSGSVTLARFEVQVALQYEFDVRDIGTNFSTGYIPYGTKAPGEYPTLIYGTEVFEVNENLRDLVSFDLAVLEAIWMISAKFFFFLGRWIRQNRSVE